MRKVSRSSVKKRTTLKKKATPFLTFGAPLPYSKGIPSTDEIIDAVNRVDPDCLTPSHLKKACKGRNCTSPNGDPGTHSKECMEDYDKAIKSE